MKLSRRALLLSASSLAMLPRKARPFILRGGGSSAGSSAALFQQTLSNIGAVNSPAGTPTETLGLAFKDSDTTGCAVGTWPVLSIGGVTQPYTPFGVGYHASGRIKRIGCVPKPTVGTNTSANQTISVSNGGSKPANSGRALTDLYGQTSWQIEATIWTAGSSANWVAPLTAASLAVATPETWGDGQAGLVFAAWFNFFPADGSFVKNSSTPHGRLLVKVYGLILNDGSNGLGGFRLCARVCQPYFNPASGTTAGIAMTTLRYSFNGTKVDFVLDKTTRSFSTPGGTTSIWNYTGNTFKNGADGNNHFAGIITSAGTTGLSTSTLYFGATFGSGLQAQISRLGTNVYGNEINSAGSSGVFQPVYYCGTAGSLYGLDSAWDWVYAQGSGSIASTSITKWNVSWTATADRNYFLNTNLVPAFDQSVTGAAYGGTVAASGTFSFSFDVNSIGPMHEGQLDGGERDDLGPLTMWSCRHIYNRDSNGDKCVKAVAYATKGSNWCVRNRLNNLTIQNIAEVSGGTSFTGFPASVATTDQTGWSGNAAAAFPLDTVFGWGLQTGSEHSPEHEYYAWLTFARPEMWDMLQEHGQNALLEISAGDHTRNPSTPAAPGGAARWYGAIAWGIGENRTWGHAVRAVLYTALGAPGKTAELAPDGTDSALYWKTLADRQLAYQKALWDPATTNSITNPASPNYSAYAASSGFWAVVWIDAVADGHTEPQMTPDSYQNAYYGIPIGVYTAATNNSDGRAMLQRVTDWMEHKRANMGPWAVVPYYAENGQQDWSVGWPIIAADNQYACWGTDAGNIRTMSGAPWFEMQVLSPYSVHDGDLVGFNHNNTVVPAPFDHFNTRYFIRDSSFVSGTTWRFNLAATAGGSVITPTTNLNTDMGWPALFHPFTFPTQTTALASGNITMQSSCINNYGLARQLSRAGCTVPSALLTMTSDLKADAISQGDPTIVGAFVKYQLAA